MQDKTPGNSCGILRSSLVTWHLVRIRGHLIRPRGRRCFSSCGEKCGLGSFLLFQEGLVATVLLTSFKLLLHVRTMHLQLSYMVESTPPTRPACVFLHCLRSGCGDRCRPWLAGCVAGAAPPLHGSPSALPGLPHTAHGTRTQEPLSA